MSGCALDLVNDYAAVIDSDMPVKDKALKVKRRSNDSNNLNPLRRNVMSE